MGYKLEPKKCAYCKKDYLGRPASRFCSRKCGGDGRRHTLDLICEHCGKTFQRQYTRAKGRGRSGGRFCSVLCSGHSNAGKIRPKEHIRILHRPKPCLICGEEFKPRSSSSTFCSYKCRAKYNRAEGNPRWNGGRSINGQGYMQIYMPDHPSAYQGRYILEHRLVMEQHMGRLLESYETVHHINGDRADNRIENLQLRQGKHGTGVAYVCLDCGSRNVQPDPLE